MSLDEINNRPARPADPARQSPSIAAASADVARRAHVFETVLSSIADFAYTFDRDGRFTYINKALLDLLGLTLEQAVGKNFHELPYPADLAAKLQRQIREVIETKRPLVDETPYTSPAGLPGFYEYIFTPVFGPDGAVEVVAGSTRVITARKQLEVDRERLLATLEHERSLLAAIIRQAPAFICTLRGPGHVFELANEHYYEIVGRRDILGKTVRAALPEVVNQGFIELLDGVYRTGETFAGDEIPVMLRRRGDDALEQRYMNLVYQAMRGPDGAVSGIFVHGVDVTDMVCARDAVRASEARFRELADAMPQIVWAATADGTLDYYNRRWFEYIGIPPELAGPATAWDGYVHPADVPRVTAAWAESLRTGRQYSIEFRVRGGDGKHCWFLVRAEPVRDAAGSIFRWYGTCTDIENRKRAEARDQFLVALDDAVRPLTDAAEITAAYARMLGEHLGADRCAYADVEADQDTFNLTGDYTRGVPSIVGRYRFADFGDEVLRLMRADAPFVVDDVDDHRPPIGDKSAFRVTMIQAVICVPLHKGGRFVAAMAVHQAVPRRWTPDEVSLVQYVAGRCWESIERGRVERTLRTSESRLRQLADAMPQMVWVTLPDGYHEYYNRRWYEFTGVPDGSTDGEGWNDMFHPDDRARAWERWRLSLATGAPYEVEYRLRHHSGEYRWTLGRALPVRNERGQIERWFGTCTDIDAIKRLTSEREQLLERERAARADAETANRAKDKFLAVLSHELRTPLNPVAMAATAMEMDPRLPFEFRDDVAMIRRNIDLETRLIDDLLDLSRINSGKLRLNPQPTDVHGLIRHVLEMIGPELHEKRSVIEQDLTASADRVEADPARLQQTLWNLLKNAAKFSPIGGRVTVRTHNDAAGRVVIAVADGGKGIRADVLPHIFNPFEQGEAEVTRQYGGLGLGLAIAKAVVDLHGGSIAAASAGEGKGATFTVALPLAKSAPLAQVADPAQPAEERTRPIRLLLVEDHPDTAKVLVRLLRSDGTEVRWAANIAAATEIAATEPFDVLVSDLGLPDGSGHDLMRQLRQRNNPLPGIALSGYGMEGDLRESQEAGFVEHLVKPVSVPQLREAIRRVAAGRRAEAGPPEGSGK